MSKMGRAPQIPKNAKANSQYSKNSKSKGTSGAHTAVPSTSVMVRPTRPTRSRRISADPVLKAHHHIKENNKY